jgi:hypothetical protein
MEDRYMEVPRKIKVTGIAATPVVVGALILRSFVDLWIVVLVVAAMAALLFVPLGPAAGKEKER